MNVRVNASALKASRIHVNTQRLTSILCGCLLSSLHFGMIPEFEKPGHYMTWFTIPFCILVSWIFRTMDKIGESSENLFQAGANDIPITGT
jgi:predicted membrane chloride channel (bestrophin family)